MSYITITLKRTFLRQASALDLPEPIHGTKAEATFELTEEQFTNLRRVAVPMSKTELPEDKLAAANIRRAAEGALRDIAAAQKEIDSRTKTKLVDPTRATYDSLTTAFDHFNERLFDSRLPPVMMVLHRKRNAHGYFWKGVWAQRDVENSELSEIALNPETMGRTPKEVLSTLVHEMVHHEQFQFGKPSKVGHNVEWCEWMERIDLTPVGVGNCAGKRSGRNFTHEIVEGGKFDTAADELLARDDFDMSWFVRPQPKVKKRDPSKVKHTCPSCGANLWCKEGLHVWCGDCDVQFQEA